MLVPRRDSSDRTLVKSNVTCFSAGLVTLLLPARKSLVNQQSSSLSRSNFSNLFLLHGCRLFCFGWIPHFVLILTDRPKHLEISIWWRRWHDHILRGDHEFIHRIATVGKLLHHVLLGLGRTLLFDADPSSPLLSHGELLFLDKNLYCNKIVSIDWRCCCQRIVFDNVIWKYVMFVVAVEDLTDACKSNATGFGPHTNAKISGS